MRQLSGMDATWLYMETDSVFGHVGGLNTFERPDDPEFDPYQAYRAQLTQHLDAVPPFRSKLLNVPLGADHPYWVDDPDFDLDRHLISTTVPAPGTDDELCAFIGEIMSRPLERDRPLWETYVIEGLAGDRFAVFWKIHHAAVDGATVSGLLSLVLTTEPTEVAVERELRPPEHGEVSDVELVARTVGRLATRPVRLARTGWSALRHVREQASVHGAGEVAGTLRRSLPRTLRRAEYDPSQPVPTSVAPPTPFNGTVTAERSLAYRRVALEDVKRAKDALGCTLNDVVMAATAGGLRRYLERHDAVPDKPLVSIIPVSIRTGEEREVWTNRISMIFPTVPVHLGDPRQRIAAVAASTDAAKRDFAILPADAMIEASELIAPVFTVQAARLAGKLRVGDRTRPFANLVISNVPGPRQPLYLGPARLERTIPVSMVFEGQGLNVTVHSYVDSVDVSCMAATNLVPDIDVLIGDIMAEFDVLFELADVE